jgi:hypothetical protein
MKSRTCRGCGGGGIIGKGTRYCAACRSLPRCHSCEKVGEGHLGWCPLSRPVGWPGNASEIKPLTAITLGWAAGFLEGEGCFPVSSRTTSTITANQKESEPLQRLQKMFGGRLYWRASGGTYGIHEWHIFGPTARGVMMTLYPLMSPRRREQIRASLTRWRQGAYRGQGHRAKRANGYQVVA